MRFIFALLLFFGVAFAALPSDEIRHMAAPDVISLQNVDPAAPKAFAAQDGNLSMFGLQELPNLGHYCTWAVTVDQDAEGPVGVPEKLLNFSTAEIVDLNQTSIGNASMENMTIINETMVWF